jgi:hypothetical protein
MKKPFLFGLIVGLALIIGGGVGASRLKQGDKPQSQYQAELEGATPVELGVLNERQRVHSKLFAGFRQGDPETIEELIAGHKGQKIVYGISVDANIPHLSAETEPPETYFARLAQASDAVIRGRVINKLSQITEDGKSLFSDYDVIVKEILKNNPGTPLAAGTRINVTCAGGKVLIGDVVVKFGGNSIASLPTNDHDVLLFVKALPQERDFKLTRYDGSFELGDGSVRALAGQFPTSYPADEHSFLETVRVAASK